MKKHLKKKILFILIGAFLLATIVSIPFIINYAYYQGYKLSVQPNTLLSAGDLIALYGSIVSGLLTFLGVYLTINHEKKQHLVEKRSFISTDEQRLVGYKLAKYKFPYNTILSNNESLDFIKKYDKPAGSINDEVQYLFDHLEHNYLAIENKGGNEIFAINIEFTTCINDGNSRVLEQQQNHYIEELSSNNTLYYLYGGPLESLKFANHYNITQDDERVEIFVYIKDLKISYTTISNERITYTRQRSSQSSTIYKVSVESDRYGIIFKYELPQLIIFYPNISAIKNTEIENRAKTYLTSDLLQKYSAGLIK